MIKLQQKAIFAEFFIDVVVVKLNLVEFFFLVLELQGRGFEVHAVGLVGKVLSGLVDEQHDVDEGLVLVHEVLVSEAKLLNQRLVVLQDSLDDFVPAIGRTCSFGAASRESRL